MFQQNERFQIFVLLALFIISPTVNGQAYVVLGDIVTYLVNLSGLQSYIFPRYPDPNILDLKDRYDFIIIGSSPTGSVLANRLTENQNVSVLLLENGEEASEVTEIPILGGVLTESKYNYRYRGQKQPGFCRGCIDGTVLWSHGNALGGSSIINFMLYSRGNRRDYDKWEQLGNPGWSFDELLPYFKKMEDSHIARNDSEYRGQGGYLTISDVKFNTKVRDVYVQACQEVGYDYVDYNGKEQLGVSHIQTTTRQGSRCSAEKSYLRPVRFRPNLKILTKAKATKIIIDPNTKTALGVEYYYRGSYHKAFVNKEVISSAGAIHSAQVLMLSGIGPKDQLDPLNIPVIQELQVGKKVYDHNNFPLIMFEVNESITLDVTKELINPLTYFEFPFGEGFLTSPGTVEAITFVKVEGSEDPDPLYPDIELLMIGGNIGSDNGIMYRKMYDITPAVFDKVLKPLEGRYVYQVTPILLHPKSYGSIQLNSSSPFDPPVLYANYFSDPENYDIKVLIGGIRVFQKINTAPSFQRYNSSLVTIPVPGCENETFDSDTYWECALRTVISSYYHQVTACKMGPKDDPEAVVDNELKVKGIKNLRVVDTSVIPFSLSTHNVAPGYVIGEKAADLIKKTWAL